MKMGEEKLRDARRIVAIGDDGVMNQLGVAHRAAGPGVDQRQLIAAVEQIDMAIGGRGEIETEAAAADQADFGREFHERILHA